MLKRLVLIYISCIVFASSANHFLSFFSVSLLQIHSIMGEFVCMILGSKTETLKKVKIFKQDDCLTNIDDGDDDDDDEEEAKGEWRKEVC